MVPKSCLLLGFVSIVHAAMLTLETPNGNLCILEAVVDSFGRDAVNSTCPFVDQMSGGPDSGGSRALHELEAAVGLLVAENAQLKARLDALENSVELPPSPPQPPSPPLPPWPPNTGLYCAWEESWEYVFELEDWDHLDDVPDAAEVIANGFRNDHAYYRGNVFLNSQDIGAAEICLGYRDTGCRDACGANPCPGGGCEAYMACVEQCQCHFDCHELTDAWAGDGITRPNPSTLSGPQSWPVHNELDTRLKKILGCFTGQCRSTSAGDGDVIGSIITPPSGHKPFSSWQAGTFPTQWWAEAGHTTKIAPNVDSGYTEMAWHAWGYGQSLWVSEGREIGRYSGRGCGVPCPEAELFRIRYKPPPPSPPPAPPVLPFARESLEPILTMSQPSNGLRPSLSAFPAWKVGTGDFTVEMWIRPRSTSTVNQAVVANSGSNTGGHWQINIHYGTKPLFGIFLGGGRPLTQGPEIPLNEWSHVAAVRVGDRVTMYSNGQTSPTYAGGPNPNAVDAFAFDFPAGVPSIGSNPAAAHAEWFNGGDYAELRITHAVRYRSTFTPGPISSCYGYDSSRCVLLSQVCASSECNK